MKLKWDESAWEDYRYWQTKDTKVLERLNEILQETMRDPFGGIGSPEPFEQRKGYWSRRIDETSRLVYKVDGDSIVIAALRGHFGK